MREPSDLLSAFQWWEDALAGRKPPIHSTPQCGRFTRRMVKGGPQVPVAIWLHQEIDPETGELTGDEVMRCTVAGREADPDEQWLYCAANPIPQEEYDYLMKFKGWAEEHHPEHPAAQPHRKIDLGTLPPVF